MEINKFKNLGFYVNHKWAIHEHLEILIYKHTNSSMEYSIDLGEGIEHIGTFDEVYDFVTGYINEAFAPCATGFGEYSDDEIAELVGE